MNRTLLAVLTLLLLLPTSAAMASGLSLYGSYWNTEDLDDVAGAGVKFSIPMGGLLNLDLRGTYYEPFDEEALREELDDPFDDSTDREIFPGEISVIPLEAGLSFNLGRGSIRPSVGAGVSYLLLDVDRGDIDDEVGWYGNIAIDFASESSVGFFVEGLYRSVEGQLNEDRDDLDFDRVDVDLTGFAVNAGIVWRW
ncbi:MAG TPA: hypothetical protein VM617_03900 [Thermoanaerobaculia bacterium]|nr:hypothetical protein [Thermoanaerobaculia bacterium]